MGVIGWLFNIWSSYWWFEFVYVRVLEGWGDMILIGGMFGLVFKVDVFVVVFFILFIGMKCLVCFFWKIVGGGMIMSLRVDFICSGRKLGFVVGISYSLEL